MKAQEFLAQHDVAVKEQVSASAKLGADDALAIARAASVVHVAKGKKLDTFTMADKPADDDLLARMLGPTGNLRAPTLRIGKVVLVGFNAEVYADVLGV